MKAVKIAIGIGLVALGISRLPLQKKQVLNQIAQPVDSKQEIIEESEKERYVSNEETRQPIQPEEKKQEDERQTYLFNQREVSTVLASYLLNPNPQHISDIITAIITQIDPGTPTTENKMMGVRSYQVQLEKGLDGCYTPTRNHNGNTLRFSIAPQEPLNAAPFISYLTLETVIETDAKGRIRQIVFSPNIDPAYQDHEVWSAVEYYKELKGTPICQEIRIGRNKEGRIETRMVPKGIVSVEVGDIEKYGRDAVEVCMGKLERPYEIWTSPQTERTLTDLTATIEKLIK